MTDNKNYMAEVKNIVDKDKRAVLMMTTEASVNGAVMGLFLGMMVGYYKKHNIYLCGLIGAVSGAVLTGVLIHKK